MILVSLAEPSPGLTAAVERRLEAISDVVPIVRARWQNGRWQPGGLSRPLLVDGDPLRSPALVRRFALGQEPPLRITIDRDRRRLAFAAHHAAFDGRGLLAIIGALLGQPLPPRSDALPAVTERSSLRDPLRRLLRPADAVAPSSPRPARESFAIRELSVHGLFTGRIAQACVAAAGAHNARHGRPWRRIGLSIARGGPAAIGNFASYRRIDLDAGDRVAPAVHRALRSDDVPPEMVFAPRLLRLLAPIATRFSDSLLVSNLGRAKLPGVEQLALFPVVHGRSAVSFGASEVEGGQATLSLRARDLSQADAEMLLDHAVGDLEPVEPA